MRAILSLVLVAVLVSGCSMMTGGRGSRDITYVIKSGDTLYELGERYGVPPEEIQAYNEIESVTNLRVGQRIVIPSVGPLKEGVREPKEANTVNQERAQLRLVSIAPVRGYIGSLEFPIDGYRPSSRFGWRWKNFHEGIDLAAPEGTPVVAAHDGTVVLVSESWSGYGKVVVIKGDRFMTVYGHNSRNRVEKGDRVKKGERIADVGQTGDATGPHLHFETRVIDEQGRYAAVNPYLFFP